MLAPRKTLHSTPLAVFHRALELVDANASDVLYDIGCGDGRCVIDAAQRLGIRSVGIEIDETRATEAAAAAKSANVDALVTIIHGNAMEFNFEDATLVFLFLIERGLRLMLPKLQQKSKPCRVVTYLYKIPDVPFRSRHFVPLNDANQDVAFPIYVYDFPLSTEPPHQ